RWMRLTNSSSVMTGLGVTWFASNDSRSRRSIVATASAVSTGFPEADRTVATEAIRQSASAAPRIGIFIAKRLTEETPQSCSGFGKKSARSRREIAEIRDAPRSALQFGENETARAGLHRTRDHDVPGRPDVAF